MFANSKLGPSGLDRPLAQHSIDVDCGSLLCGALILGREDIDEAYCKLSRHETTFDTIHIFLHSIEACCCGRDSAFLVLGSFVVSGLLQLLPLQCVP